MVAWLLMVNYGKLRMIVDNGKCWLMMVENGKIMESDGWYQVFPFFVDHQYANNCRVYQRYCQ